MKTLIYCTKVKKRYRILHQVFFSDELYRLPNGEIKFGSSVELMAYDNYDKNNFLNGKVVASFDFDRWDLIEVSSRQYNAIKKEACMTIDEIINYCNGNDLYAWHIDNLQAFDKPIELSELGNFNKVNVMFKNQLNGKRIFGNSVNCKEEEFRRLHNGIGYYGCKLNKNYEEDCDWEYCPKCKLIKAPQSYQYVYYKGEKCLLLSVKSKWVEKILNGEKTIEIRKNVPKEVREDE